MDWAGATYEVGFFKNVGFRSVVFSKMIFFTNGVPVGDLGAKIAGKFSQQRYLGATFGGFWGGGGAGGSGGGGLPHCLGSTPV